MNEFDRPKRNEAKERKKKALLTGIIMCIIIIVMLACLIMYYQNVDKHTFKLFIDEQKVGFAEGFYFTNEAGETYVRARDIANLIGWKYENGEYGSYTEDTNSGYIQNDYEIASFVAGETELKKYIQNNAVAYDNELGEHIEPFETNTTNGTLETSTLELPVISMNEQIYFPLRSLNDICNCLVNYDDPFRMYIYEQNYLINIARTNAAQFGYKNVSSIYENIRLLAYGKMVVSNGSLYGVSNLFQNSTVIGLKYKEMIYAQNTKEFFVKTLLNNEESVGIINSLGEQVVAPKNFSNIRVLNDKLGLYLVEKDEQYGVLDKSGKVIIHCEYDEIGVPEDIISTFKFSVEDDKYLLFDKIIVVQKDEKVGLYDVEGNQLLTTSYVGLGYIADEDKDAIKNSEDVLTITIDELKLLNGITRDVKAIILQQEIDGVKKYGAYDIESKNLILPCNYDRIFGMTSKGNTEYYIEFQGQRAKFSDQLAAHPDIFNSAQ